MSTVANKSKEDENRNKEQISTEFPFRSDYIEIHDSKIHYIDEGKGKGESILFLHGNPTSYTCGETLSRI